MRKTNPSPEVRDDDHARGLGLLVYDPYLPEGLLDSFDRVMPSLMLTRKDVDAILRGAN